MASPEQVIKRWLSSPPDNAHMCRLTTRHRGEIKNVIEFPKLEIESLGPERAVEKILDAAESYTDGLGKELFFDGQWLDSLNHNVKGIEFRILPTNGVSGFPTDGTPESWSAQLQAFSAQKDRAMLDMMRAMSDLIIQQSVATRDKLESLEVREAELLQLKQVMIETKAGDELSPLIEARINKALDVFEKIVVSGLKTKRLPKAASSANRANPSSNGWIKGNPNSNRG